ncbi:Methyltransferase domain family [Verrucomicrobiia bacterium DG1235]|nr:Methyltransferase domain family [Verrucomicrobiae bacterium DG1235]
MKDKIDPVEVAKFENETWSRCASGYIEGFGALVAEAIDSILAEASVKNGTFCLDVGTGPGNTAKSASELGARTIGIDFSDTMLAEARVRNPELEFLNASAEKLPFADDEFDAVVGNYILHHSGEPEKILSDSFRVLKPGGKAAFTVWSKPEKLEAFGLFFGAVGEHLGSPDLPHGPLFGISDFDHFHHLLREAGFTKTSVRELPTVWKTPSISSYLRAFHDWANLNVVDKEIREKIEETILKSSGRYQSEGVYYIPNPSILLSGTKAIY